MLHLDKFIEAAFDYRLVFNLILTIFNTCYMRYIVLINGSFLAREIFRL